MIGSFKRPNYFKIPPYFHPDRNPLTPEEKYNEEREKYINDIKFVIVAKNQYDDYKKLQKQKQHHKAIILSDNLKATKASMFIDKMRKTKNLLGHKVLKPSRPPTGDPIRDVETISGQLSNENKKYQHEDEKNELEKIEEDEDMAH